MKIAMLYANWEAFGEPWSTPRGVRTELEGRGHEVSVFNLYHNNGHMVEGGPPRNYSNEGLNKLHNDIRHGYKPDVILVMDYGPWQTDILNPHNFPGAVLIKEAGDEPQSHRMHYQSAHHFHGIMSPDYQCVERYRSAGMKAIWWTHHADINIFHPREDVQVEFDCVTTCGPRQNGLTEKVKEALGDSFNNERYFHGDEHGKRLCMGNMVFQCSQHGEITRRIFEGMACGKMVITDRLPELTNIGALFEEGKHIVYYDDAADAIAKIRYYADHEEKRLAIARAGMEEVLTNHTMSARVDAFEDLVEEVKREAYNDFQVRR